MLVLQVKIVFIISKFCNFFLYQGFNWYGTEKLIKKYLSSRGIPTYIYYFKREGASTNNKRSHDQSHENNKRLSIESKTFAHFKDDNNDLCISEKLNNIERLKVHLPNYLSDVHIFFHDIDDNTKNRLQRFVYAYVYYSMFVIEIYH